MEERIGGKKTETERDREIKKRVAGKIGKSQSIQFLVGHATCSTCTIKGNSWV